MSKFFIDFENVRSEGLRGIENLTENDQVWIFYSKNADSITFEVYDLIGRSKAKIHKYKIARGGKNSLDFQLSSFVGYMLHEDWFDSYYIISKDNGYRYVLDFWRLSYERQGVRLFEIPSIQDALKPVGIRKEKPAAETVAEEKTVSKIQETTEPEEEEILQGELVSYVELPESVQEDITEVSEEKEPKAAEKENGSKSKGRGRNSRNRKRGQEHAESEAGSVAESAAETQTAQAEKQAVEAPQASEGEEAATDSAAAAAEEAVIVTAPVAENADGASEDASKKEEKSGKAKSRRGRKKASEKASEKTGDEAESTEAVAEEPAPSHETKSKRGRRKKSSEKNTDQSVPEQKDAKAKDVKEKDSKDKTPTEKGLEEEASKDKDSKEKASKNKDSKESKDSKEKASKEKATKEKPAKESHQEPVVPRLAKGEVRSKLNYLLTKANLPESVDLSTCVKRSAEFVIESDGKKAFYDRVISFWGQKVGMEIYKVLKTEYPNLKKIIVQATEEKKN